MAFWNSPDASPARKYRFKVGPEGVIWWYANSVTLPSFDINVSEYQLVNQRFKIPGTVTWGDVTINMVDVSDSIERVKKVLAGQDVTQTGPQIEGVRKEDNELRKRLLTERQQKITIGTLGAENPELFDNDPELNRLAQRSIQNEDEMGGSNRTSNTDAPIRPQSDEMMEALKVSQKTIERRYKERGDQILAQERAKLAKTEPEDFNDIIIEQLKSDGSKLRTWTLVNSFIRSVNYGDLDYSSDDLVSLEIVIGYDFCKIE